MLRGEADEEELAKCIHFEQFLDRDSNAGFSGCEIKRSELLQLMAQDPDFRHYLLVTDLGIEKDHNLNLKKEDIQKLKEAVRDACTLD